MGKNNDGVLDNTMNHLALHAPFLGKLGLYKGKLGIIIVCYHYARITGRKIYVDIADALLDDTLSHLSATMPLGLSDGICGIGWGICHLLENHFVEGDAIEILQEVDNRIFEYDPLRMMDLSLETGIGGIAVYITKRNKLLGCTNTYSEEYKNKVKARIGYIYEMELKHFINMQEAMNVSLENNWYQLGLNNGCAGKAWLLMNQ